MKFIIFKKYNTLFAIPSYQASKPQVRKLLERSILVEVPEGLVITPKVYKIKKVVPKTHEIVKPKVRKVKREIRREYRPMPKSLQIEMLKKYVKKYGVSPDLIDFEALVDSSLSLPENREIIKGQIKSLTRDLDVIAEEISLGDLERQEKEFIQEVIWRWESGDKEYFKDTGIDIDKIKKKDDLLRIFGL